MAIRTFLVGGHWISRLMAIRNPSGKPSVTVPIAGCATPNQPPAPRIGHRAPPGRRLRSSTFAADGIIAVAPVIAPHRQLVIQPTATARNPSVDPARALRYAWPAELDVMARLAGLRLRERSAGWRREPFTAAARGHVSVYERA